MKILENRVEVTHFRDFRDFQPCSTP